jgi:predicted DNA-binding transcriptional regulator AlpA
MATATTAPAPSAGQKRLIDVKELGQRLGMSWRTALRHADAGLIPFGIKLGGLRRWSADEIDQWIAAGCKPVRTTKGVK